MEFSESFFPVFTQKTIHLNDKHYLYNYNIYTYMYVYNYINLV